MTLDKCTTFTDCARDISIFAKPRRKPIDRSSKACLGDRDVGKLCRQHLETFIIPARAFGISRGVGWGRGGSKERERMMAVTRKLLSPIIPRAIRALHTRENGLRWGYSTFFTLPPQRLVLSHAYFIIYQGSIMYSALATRIVAHTLFPR